MDKKVEQLQLNYSQDSDVCDSNDVQNIQITFEDGGGGHFMTIKTERWAFDTVEELESFLKNIHDLVNPLLNPLSED